MTIKQNGLDKLTKVISHFRSKYSLDRISMIETQGYYETIMTTAFLKVLKESKKDVILWGMSENIYKQFDSFSLNAGCVVFSMPSGATHADRTAWVDFASSQKITMFSTQSGLIKAGKHKPFIPTTNEDNTWFNNFYKSDRPLVISDKSDLIINDKYGTIDISELTLQQTKACINKASFVVTSNNSLLECLALCEGSSAQILKDVTSQDQLNKALGQS